MATKSRGKPSPAAPAPEAPRDPETWGYARVSTDDQDCALQVAALRAAGVPDDHIVRETMSGAKERPALTALCARLRAGDSLIIWKVDRVGRDTIDSLIRAKELRERGVRLHITTLGLDLDSPAGKIVYGFLAQVAEIERDNIIERVRCGMAAAKAAGKHVGRPRKMTSGAVELAVRLLDEGKTGAAVARDLGVSEATLWHWVAKARAKRAAVEAGVA